MTMPFEHRSAVDYRRDISRRRQTRNIMNHINDEEDTKNASCPFSEK